MHTSQQGCDSHGENSWPFEMQGREKGIQRRNSSEWEKKPNNYPSIKWNSLKKISNETSQILFGVFLDSMPTLHGKNLEQPQVPGRDTELDYGESKQDHTHTCEFRFQAHSHTSEFRFLQYSQHTARPCLCSVHGVTQQTLERRSQGKMPALDFCLSADILQSQC